MLNCMATPPTRETGAVGLVMSWTFALPLNCPLQGDVEVAPALQPDTHALFTHWYIASEVMELPLIWYTCWMPSFSLRRTMVLMLPCKLVPLLLYLTLNPKLLLVPTSPEIVPAEFCMTK